MGTGQKDGIEANRGRVALVIGNGAYANAPELRNPRNDAAAIAEMLRDLDFKVIEGLDLTVTAMDSKISEFARETERAETALFYYAGHGLQVDGENYLVPVDAKLEHVGELNRQTLKLQDQLTMMADGASVSIALLDCCRDNPFVRSLARRRSGATRSIAVQNGLAEMDTEGSMIAFATGPGSVAQDGDGANSPFTAALLRHLPTAGLSLADMMTEVTNTVAERTQNRQVPWFHSSLRKRVVLRPQAPSLQQGPGLPFVPEGATREVVSAPSPNIVSGRSTKFWVSITTIFFVVAMTGVGAVLIGGRDVDPPKPDIPGDPALLARLDSINDANGYVRSRAVAVFEAALTRPNAFESTDALNLAVALVRMAADKSMRGLSAEGRYNLFYLLAKIPPGLWEERAWATTRAELRKALADLSARAAAGEMSIGPQTEEILKPLRNAVSPPATSTKLVINFANMKYGGTMSLAEAEAAKKALGSLGWNVDGLDGAAETARSAMGTNEVRYGSDRDLQTAGKVILDLHAAGYGVASKPVKVSTIGAKPLEIWLSKAAPADSWTAAPPKAGWCFQRLGPMTELGQYSVRCHRDATTCKSTRDGSPGERSSDCAFIAFLNRTSVTLRGGGTADSWFAYSRNPFNAPFPSLQK